MSISTNVNYGTAGLDSELNQWIEIGGPSMRFSAPSPNGLNRPFHHSEGVAKSYIDPQFQASRLSA